jgi:hypothetical protein
MLVIKIREESLCTSLNVIHILKNLFLCCVVSPSALATVGSCYVENILTIDVSFLWPAAKHFLLTEIQ